MYALMTFKYKEIEKGNEDFNITIDDLTMYPPCMTVSIGGENVDIGIPDDNGIIHFDFDTSSFYVSEDMIEIKAHLDFIWTENAGYDFAVQCALDKEEQVLEIIKSSNPNNIVPYTKGILVNGLQLVGLSFVKDNALIRELPEAECKNFDIEQYDSEEEYYWNYGLEARF